MVPFEISQKIGEVTYDIVVPGRRSGKIRVHVNMLKEWKQSESSVLRVVVDE